MCKKYLPFMRSFLVLLIASWSILLTGCKTTIPPDNSLEELARERLGVSILTVNLLGVYNVPRNSQSGVPWRTRYAQIFKWMSEDKIFPDVIALQEATAFMQCAFNPTVRDYEAIEFLRNGISDAAGEQYRIAYFIVGKPGGGTPTDYTGDIPSGGCSSTGGNALLYRPSKLKNIIFGPSSGEPVVSPYDDPLPLLTTYFAMSAQCCPLNPDGSDACPVTEFMDGPMIRPRVGPVFRDTCPTRQGVALTRSRKSDEGADKEKPRFDAVFSRFELVAEPGNFIHIYNVHRGTAAPPGQLYPGAVNIDSLVADVETRFNSINNPTLYPPIVVGDLNFGFNNMPPTAGEVEGQLPRYRMAAWSPENVGVVIGRPENFRAKQYAYANQVKVIPATNPGEACDRDPATLWSDHCGFYFRIEPSL